jgi:hypothetical protein
MESSFNDDENETNDEPDAGESEGWTDKGDISQTEEEQAYESEEAMVEDETEMQSLQVGESPANTPCGPESRRQSLRQP